MAKKKEEFPIRNNDMAAELLAIHAMNPFTPNNAPARGTMFSGHFSQRPVIEGSEPNYIQTGVEEEFGKYTFAVKMPEDGTITRVIHRYPRGLTDDSMNFNPETLVIYRSRETGEHDCFVLPYHLSHHPSFGFKYEQKPIANEIAVGRDFEKDTVFADSPAVKGESHYTYGKNLNVIQMSHPNVGLDGYVINRAALKHFKFRVYESRSIELGANTLPINLYGDDQNYKPFPDIGEFIREDGLLMASRRFDPHMSPALLSKRDLRRVDYLFDNRVYVRAGKGRVVDLNVVHSDNVNRQLPPEMTKQLEKYSKANERFHQDIVKYEEQLIRESMQSGGDGKINISKSLQRLIVMAKGITNYGSAKHRQSLTLTHKREPLDTWRLNFTVEYEIVPDRGFKLSCCNGGKGVICRIEEPENMPVDADGNVADIISGPDSVPGRMNLGRLYAPYFNGAARDVKRQIMDEMGFGRYYDKKLCREELEAVPREMFNKGLDSLLKFYSIVSPRTFREYTELITVDEQYDWLLMVFNDAPYLYIPVDTEVPFDEMVVQIEQNFKLVYGPVSYVGRSGQRVVTKNKFRIAPLYMMLLDKIADAWLSADIGKHSNFGILAAMNQGDKFSTPWRKTPPRGIGETEGRLYCMYGGREMIAEMMDRNGNIASQKEIARNIIRADYPTRIDRIVDRAKIPLGNARPNQMLHHIFRCVGFDVVYKPEKRR